MTELIYKGKICPYCFKKTVYIDSEKVYVKSYGMIYFCRSCDAWVGVHKGSNISFGRLANSELREARKKAHYFFDKLWNEKIRQGFTKTKAREKAYEWLSNELKMSRKETHISWFDVDMCKKAEVLCKYYVDKLKL